MSRVLLPPVDDPDLPAAQYAAFSRLAPMLYVILAANGWGLAAGVTRWAPAWLALGVPAVVTVAYAARLATWQRMRRQGPAAALRRANTLTVGTAVASTAWALALLPYGDTTAQLRIALFLALSTIGSMLCLTHLRSAALVIAAVEGGACVILFAASGFTVAVNVLIVTAAAVMAVLIHGAEFARMATAQSKQSRLSRMLDDLPIAVMTAEPDTLTITYANDMARQLVRRIEHLLPIQADALLGAGIDLFHTDPAQQRALLADPANLPHRTRITLGPEVLDLQLSALTASDGGYLGPMLALEIVTQTVEAEDRIQQLARFDTLTGLLNRAAFHEALDAILGVPGRTAALLFVDLDGFKLVNDSKGHRVGDMLLQQVAGRLRATCGAPDTLAGRIGGDEFAILQPGADAAEAAILAARLIEAISAPYRIGHDSSVRIGASIGIALAPVHGSEAATLLGHADIALYAAKAAGRRTSRLFTTDMDVRIQERAHLEARLRDALDDPEGLFVFYQPVVDIRTRAVTAREALMRWHHPHRGWVAPSEFIPIAEQSGLISQLGLFVLNNACREAAIWPDRARVAINVSPGQIGKGVLVAAVLAALADSGLPPSRLELEVTETALVQGEAEGIEELRVLRGMGVRVALDDFGTGYSSLAHLRALPFDKIKIDGSFVQDALARPDCAAVVGAVADLGKRLGVTTVAEGVEIEAQFDCVAAEGCSEVQGYLFGRPKPSTQDALRVAAVGGGPD